MSEYTKRLYKFINKQGFVRTFYGECPQCGKHVFSIGDEVVENSAIKAKFVCSCGKKWKETVYSREMKKYKYQQTIPEDYQDPKRGRVKVLKVGNRMFLVTPEKIMSKEIKR